MPSDEFWTWPNVLMIIAIVVALVAVGVAVLAWLVPRAKGGAGITASNGSVASGRDSNVTIDSKRD